MASAGGMTRRTLQPGPQKGSTGASEITAGMDKADRCHGLELAGD